MIVLKACTVLVCMYVCITAVRGAGVGGARTVYAMGASKAGEEGTNMKDTKRPIRK